ncbi:MAG: hypothetical protein WD669_09110 [Pirellulales bacterium]
MNNLLVWTATAIQLTVTRCRPRLRSSLILLSLSLCVLFPARAFPDAPILEKIINDWKAREAETKSLHIRWTEVNTYTKGSQLQPASTSKPKGLYPPNDEIINDEWTVHLDDNKFRYRRDGSIWDDVAGDFVYSPHTFCYDGRDARFLYHSITMLENRGLQRLPGDTCPIGYLKTLSQADDYYRNYHFQAIIDTYRPLMRPFSIFRSNEWSVLADAASLGDSSCVILRWSHGQNRPASARFEIWVDPTKRSVIKRIQRLSESGSLAFSLDIEHELDRVGNWNPKSWKISVNYEDGQPQLLCNSVVNDIELNPKFDENPFVFNFPIGTRVRDSTKLTKGFAESVIQNDGTWRAVLPAEESSLYRVLMTTKTGEALISVPSSRNFFAIALTSVVCFVLLILIAKKYRSNMAHNR